MYDFVKRLGCIGLSERIINLRNEMLNEDRVMSVEQAKLITQVYKQHADKPIILKRALALNEALRNIEIVIHEGELIVGNRTVGSCAGVVFPEAGISWLMEEIDDLPTRPQDYFLVRHEDREYFFKHLVPFWQGHTLEDKVNEQLDPQVKMLEVVGKLNQKDHAQGHICPDVKKWISQGPYNLMQEAKKRLKNAEPSKRDFYQAMVIALEGACVFIERYGRLASRMADKSKNEGSRLEYLKIAESCYALSKSPASNFREAVQSLWFLFVILQMESNASSFSPGRADQYLYPYYIKDMRDGTISLKQALELIEALFIKFNQIVYMRNTKCAEFFAGFPIGFNIAIGGQNIDGSDASNELSYIMLRAMENVRLRQPNLSARLHANSPELFVRRVAEVIGKGIGMPQIFNDESVIPALKHAGYSHEDAVNYAVVGCVELSTHGNALGFSDAAMFNMVKVLELTLNNGVCMQTGKQLGLRLGKLTDFSSFEQLEDAYRRQIEYFIEKMMQGLEVIERLHQECMPSPFLSSVVNDCMEKGIDVTRGGAHYNFSGIQAIQVANLADSMAALKHLVYDTKEISAKELLYNLQNNYPDEKIRLKMLTHAPKYGNDVQWVDEIGNKWVEMFYDEISKYTNYRGGKYTLGLYTVSAHVPMGNNVAATPDGRRNREPLADGGLSAVYGRDQCGPTALLNSVSRIRSYNVANGSLLNMKFSPKIFKDENSFEKFCAFIRGFIALRINHVQFNVFNKQDLIEAKKNPEKYRHLLVRVAGYTANYVDLDQKLQDEIIARTEYGV